MLKPGDALEDQVRLPASATPDRHTRDAKVDEISLMDEQESMVDETGDESFPASDPPSWTLGEPAKGVPKFTPKRSY